MHPNYSRDFLYIERIASYFLIEITMKNKTIKEANEERELIQPSLLGQDTPKRGNFKISIRKGPEDKCTEESSYQKRKEKKNKS
jgi:hypothetical protein